jgi:hypothetical protein
MLAFWWLLCGRSFSFLCFVLFPLFLFLFVCLPACLLVCFAGVLLDAESHQSLLAQQDSNKLALDSQEAEVLSEDWSAETDTETDTDSDPFVSVASSFGGALRATDVEPRLAASLVSDCISFQSCMSPDQAPGSVGGFGERPGQAASVLSFETATTLQSPLSSTPRVVLLCSNSVTPAALSLLPSPEPRQAADNKDTADGAVDAAQPHGPEDAPTCMSPFEVLSAPDLLASMGSDAASAEPAAGEPDTTVAANGPAALTAPARSEPAAEGALASEIISTPPASVLQPSTAQPAAALRATRSHCRHASVTPAVLLAPGALEQLSHATLRASMRSYHQAARFLDRIGAAFRRLGRWILRKFGLSSSTPVPALTARAKGKPARNPVAAAKK